MDEFTFTIKNWDGEATVVFEEASPEQIVSCRVLAGAEFGKPLTVDDYLNQVEYPHLGWRIWCLSLAHDPTQVLATCKTIPRELVIRHVSGTSRGKGYCIASVVTHPEYRNQGMASRLLEYVSRWLDGPGDAAASMLYTSIGDFYDRRGWKKMAAYQASLSWPVNFSLAADRDQLPGTRSLLSVEIPELCARDVRDVEYRMDSLLPKPSESQVCVLPTDNLITWFHDASDFVCTKINGTSPQSRGSVCKSADAWLYWAHDFRKQQLAIQRIRVPPETNQTQSSALVAMLLDAVEEAQVWSLPQVTIWEPSDTVLEAISVLQENFGIRSEAGARLHKSVPSLRWRYADESNKAMFYFNEFYTWN